MKDVGIATIGAEGEPPTGDTPSIGGLIRAAVRASPSGSVSVIADLDCSHAGNRIFLHHPGRDRLNVEVETITAALTTGVLKIKTALDDGAKTGVAPNSSVDITSTAGTQKQSGLDVTGQHGSWVEASTAQADLLVKVRITAMKS